MVTIKEIKELPAELHHEDSGLVGVIETCLQLNDVRIQIREEESSKYFIKFLALGREYTYRIRINNKGNLDSWPRGFFDTWDHQLDKLLNF